MNGTLGPRTILDGQQLAPRDWWLMGRAQEKVLESLGVLPGNPTIYYGGSKAKNTMIRERYDLDLVLFWPDDCGRTLKDLFRLVGSRLRRNGGKAEPKTVAWHRPCGGGLHVDVVPARAIDDASGYANLYRRPDSSLQTNLELHVQTVRDSGRRDVIRLMKLWRLRRNLPLPSSLFVEILTIRATQELPATDLDEQLLTTFEFIEANIDNVRIEDPANSNNVLSDELKAFQRRRWRQEAVSALRARSWAAVFRKRDVGTT